MISFLLHADILRENYEYKTGIVRARSNPGSYCIMEHIIYSKRDLDQVINSGDRCEHTAFDFQR